MNHRGLLAILALAISLLTAVLAAAPAQGAFGLSDFDVTFTNADGSPATQAGSHPFAMTTSFAVESQEVGFFEWEPEGQIKDLFAEQVAGLVADATYPRCSVADFSNFSGAGLGARPGCPDSTAIGVAAAYLLVPPPLFWIPASVYNVEPPPGVPARIAFVIGGQPVVIDLGIEPGGDNKGLAKMSKIPQVLILFGGELQVWGVPADPVHDNVRGSCFPKVLFNEGPPDFGPSSPLSTGLCPAGVIERPLLTLPSACMGPVATNYEADSWEHPGAWVIGSVLTHDDAEPPNPIGFSGCGKLPFSPTMEAKATTDSAESGTGLDVDVGFNDEGFANPDGIVQSSVKKTIVTLPAGVTVNPSVGEGLGVCTPQDLERESLEAEEGEGCPNSSKIGTVHVDTPLVDEGVDGSVYLAEQDDPTTVEPGAENTFDSLIAFYIVLKNRNIGVLVKLPAKVEPDPRTGQLVTTLDDTPQLPFSNFHFHFREGQRAPLITPPACGTYKTKAEFYPWSDPDNPRTVVSDFQITSGVGGGPCPPGGVPPFKPGFEAGSLNNNAKAFSPFHMRLTRGDGEQDMTKFSSVLPPGVLGKLAGVGKCADAAIEAAKAKSGKEELASRSCPANSQIGRTLAGAGVGGALTYVPGQIYLGGPYKGAPLSVISVTPAVAGPFDAGAVVVRLGLTLNPVTAEVEVDGAASDPIPHILKGIVLKVRDLRVYVDRPNFILNPTSCDPSSAKATLFGSFLDVFNPADDVPVDLATRYQAANCLNLGFRPALKLNLKGGTKRGDHPGLKAALKARPGDANIGAAQVTLPRSAFLDQAHIRTICTRVQYAADQCPKGSIYGHAKAITPLLDDPIEGPVILRSSNNKLPDLVIALKGLVDVDVSSRIDSKNGGIRNTFDVVPDAPVTSFTLTLQGGKKGLVINSRDLCEGKTSRANVRFVGQNGRVANLRPQLKPQCGGKRKK
jgi:hypothetical protein